MDTYKLLQERLLKINLGFATLGALIPPILWLIEGERYKSVSDYARSPHPHILATLLTISAMAFIYDGIAHRLKWYQIVIGGFLLGVAWFPVNLNNEAHIWFTALFFTANSITMIATAKKKYKLFNTIIALLMLGGIVASFKYELFPVFYAEWFAFNPMVVKYYQDAFEFYRKIKSYKPTHYA